LSGEKSLTKSKSRVRKYGEVFTPQWIVDKMLSIPGIKEKTEDVFATFLEPAAGEGVFLLAIEKAKLQAATERFGRDLWGVYALWALSSIYGIELLDDNLAIARQSMLDLFSASYKDAYGEELSEDADLYKSAKTIIWANVVQGDTLARRNSQGEEIVFSQWLRIPDNERLVERTTFTYSSLFEEGEDATAARYAIVSIEQAWREEV
jgi:hypothetical protein